MKDDKSDYIMNCVVIVVFRFSCDGWFVSLV